MNTFFHCSYSIIKKNIKMYIILILQIVIINFVFIGLIGKLQFLSSSNALSKAFCDSNAFYFSPYMFIDENTCDMEKLLFDETDEKIEIGKIFNLALSFDNNISYAYGYNQAILNFADINMKTGEWFDFNYNYKYLPVIGIGDEYSIGNIIEFENPDNGYKQKAQIIGTIDEKEYIIKFNKNGSESIASIGYFVSPPAENYKFIFPYDCDDFISLNNLIPIKSMPFENQIIILSQKTNTDFVKNILKHYGTSVDIQQMNKNFKNENKDHFITNGIVFIVFFLLAIASIGGTNGIQSILNQKRFIIYYILGLTKIKCAFIEAMRSFFIIISSFSITILLYYLIPTSSIYSVDEFKINVITFVYIFIFILILYCVTSVFYVIKLGNKNLIESYKQNT